MFCMCNFNSKAFDVPSEQSFCVNICTTLPRSLTVVGLSLTVATFAQISFFVLSTRARTAISGFLSLFWNESCYCFMLSSPFLFVLFSGCFNTNDFNVMFFILVYKCDWFLIRTQCFCCRCCFLFYVLWKGKVDPVTHFPAVCKSSALKSIVQYQVNTIKYFLIASHKGIWAIGILG